MRSNLRECGVARLEFLAMQVMIDKYCVQTDRGMVTFELFVEFSASNQEDDGEHATAQLKVVPPVVWIYFSNLIFPRLSKARYDSYCISVMTNPNLCPSSV